MHFFSVEFIKDLNTFINKNIQVDYLVVPYINGKPCSQLCLNLLGHQTTLPNLANESPQLDIEALSEVQNPYFDHSYEYKLEPISIINSENITNISDYYKSCLNGIDKTASILLPLLSQGTNKDEITKFIKIAFEEVSNFTVLVENARMQITLVIEDPFTYQLYEEYIRYIEAISGLAPTKPDRLGLVCYS